MKKEKTEVVIFNLKIEKDIKDRFIAVAKANDENGSMLIRKYMKKYLSENSQTKEYSKNIEDELNS